MEGFKNFIMRGNLVELAVAFIMGAAFATVVTSFTEVIMGLIGKVGGEPDFTAWTPFGLPIGSFLTALVAFLILSAIVYFFVVKPYEAAKERFSPTAEEDAGSSSEDLLAEIRDILRAKN